MTTTRWCFAAAGALLAAAVSVQAHHSGSMYRAVPDWIQGTVMRFEPSNPHTLMTLESHSDTGERIEWVVEGPPRTAVERNGLAAHVPQLGDVVRFCAFPYKSVDELRLIFPEADFSRARTVLAADASGPRYVAGHVMIRADGQLVFWEPHGVLAECMRSADEPQRVWLDFLNTSQQALQGFCEQRRYALVQSNPDLLSFVEATNAQLAEPCR